jgi:hypothetical protein
MNRKASTIKLHIKKYTREWTCRQIPNYPISEELMNWGPGPLAQRLNLPPHLTRIHFKTRHYLTFNKSKIICDACTQGKMTSIKHVITECDYPFTNQARTKTINTIKEHNESYIKLITQPTPAEIIWIFSGEDITVDKCRTLTVAYLRILLTNPLIFTEES